MITKKAVVLENSEHITENSVGDVFRPRYACNVEMLDEFGKLTGEVIEQLGLPSSYIWGLPDPGTIVRIGYDYDREDHPYISDILAEEREIPANVNEEIIIYSSEDCKISLNKRTAKIRIESLGNIELDADEIKRTGSIVDNIVDELKLVELDSTEEITGSKTIEAMGNILIEAGESLRLTSLGNAHQNLLAGLSTLVGNNRRSIVGINDTTIVTGLNWIGSPATNIFLVLSNALIQLTTVLTDLAIHKHPSDGAPPDSSLVYTTAKTAVAALQTEISLITNPTSTA